MLLSLLLVQSMMLLVLLWVVYSLLSLVGELGAAMELVKERVQRQQQQPQPQCTP